MKPVIRSVLCLILLVTGPSFAVDEYSGGALITDINVPGVDATTGSRTWQPTMGEILRPATRVDLSATGKIDVVHLETNEEASVNGPASFTIGAQGFSGLVQGQTRKIEGLNADLDLRKESLNELCAVSSDHMNTDSKSFEETLSLAPETVTREPFPIRERETKMKKEESQSRGMNKAAPCQSPAADRQAPFTTTIGLPADLFPGIEAGDFFLETPAQTEPLPILDPKKVVFPGKSAWIQLTIEVFPPSENLTIVAGSSKNPKDRKTLGITSGIPSGKPIFQALQLILAGKPSQAAGIILTLEESGALPRERAEIYLERCRKLLQK